MQEIWARIEMWLAQNENPLTLNDGATEEEICCAEEVLGCRLPNDLRESLKIHNGQRSANLDMGLIENTYLLSVQEIVEQWSVWKGLYDSGDFDGDHSESTGPIKTDQWWNPRWIPITHDGGGNHYCIDLDPGVGGNPGQIITMWHDDWAREHCAVSFYSWMEQFAQNFENGVYRVADSGYGCMGLFRNNELV